MEFVGSTVTVMSPEGQPIQVNPSALQSVAAQASIGRSTKGSLNVKLFETRIANKIVGFYLNISHNHLTRNNIV